MKITLEKIAGFVMASVGAVGAGASVASISHDPHNYLAYATLGSCATCLIWGVEYLSGLSSFRGKDEDNLKGREIPTSFECDGCDQPITIKSGEILTDKRGKKQLYFHTCYHPDVRQQTGMTENIIAFFHVYP
jgi:hypothetical protein